jgi:hypothetical protein
VVEYFQLTVTEEIMQNLIRDIVTWLVICIVGIIAGPLFWLFVLLGLIRVQNYWSTFWAIKRGNLEIVSNHPFMWDPLLFIAMWWPWCLFFPRRFLLWNLPGWNYFDDILMSLTKGRWVKFPEWIYPIIHCVPVDRDGVNFKEVLRKAKQVLKEGRTLVIFAEMGRTGSKPRNQPDTDVEFVYSDDGQRQVRPFTAAVTKFAANEETCFITVWAEVSFWKESPGFGLRTWLQGRHCVTITFSDSYKPDLNLRGSDLKADTQKRVLHTHK